MSTAPIWGENWLGRRVLVTGHTGFKGAWLAAWLTRLGAEVTGYALTPEHQRGAFVSCGLEREIESVIGDVRDARKLSSLVAARRPEAVFHLAAQALVRTSYEEPKATFETNVQGTVNVLEAVRACPDTRVAVMVTSDKCYENREWVWPYRERDRLGGRDPYSASKAAAEIAVGAYRESFFRDSGTAVPSVRAGNVIGGGDRCRDRIVPDMVAAIEAGKPLRVRNPGSIRPWQHVLEPVGAYLLLAGLVLDGRDDLDEPWNFGPDPAVKVTVRELVEMLLSGWGSGDWTDESEGDAPHEAGTLALDSGKARERFGWKPVLDVREAVGWTVDWYRGQSEGSDCLETTLAQAAEYERRAAQAWSRGQQ